MWEPNYAEVEDLKAYVSIPEGDTADDAELSGKIAAASRSIDRHCRRQFGKVEEAETRVFTGQCRAGGVLVQPDDFVDLTGMTVTVDGAVVVPMRAWPPNAPVKGKPFTRLWLPSGTSTAVDGISIETDRWGWAAIPAAVHEACLLQASRLFKRRDAPFGVAGSPDLGSELRLLAKVDPDVSVMLKQYVRYVTVG